MAVAWRAAAVDDPLGYLGERTGVFAREISLTHPSFLIYHPYIDANPFGYHDRFPALRRAADGYLRVFTTVSDPRDPLPDYDGDVLFDVWAYLLVALGISIVHLRRRDWTSRILGAVALAASPTRSASYSDSQASCTAWSFPRLRPLSSWCGYSWRAIYRSPASCALRRLPRLTRAQTSPRRS